MARTRTTRNDRSRSGAAIGRAVGLAAFLPLASRAPSYARLIWALVRDDRTPLGRKAVLLVAACYVVLGRDLIPDDAPVLGGLDDLVVVVLAVETFFDGVPDELLHEKLDELGIDRGSFDQDIAQIRRLTPKSVRRAIRRAPQAATAAWHALNESGLGPRLRSWIAREGSTS